MDTSDNYIPKEDIEEIKQYLSDIEQTEHCWATGEYSDECDCGYGCMSDINDDDFDLAEKDLLIDRLNDPKSNAPRNDEERSLMVKVLKDIYDYDYKEK